MLPIRKAFDAILLASMLPSRFENLIVVRLLSVQSISTHLMRFVQCRICSVSVTFAHCRMGCMSVLSHSLCVCRTQVDLLFDLSRIISASRVSCASGFAYFLCGVSKCEFFVTLASLAFFIFYSEIYVFVTTQLIADHRQGTAQGYTRGRVTFAILI